MEFSYAKDGSVKFPVGYRFCPTDDVLVGYYLRKKAFDQPLPNSLIPEFDVYLQEPKNLPGGGKNFSDQKYFFYHLKTHVFENPEKRAVTNGSGQWVVVKKGLDIVVPKSTQLTGKKNIFVFWEAKGTGFVKTNWIMHEFQLALKANPTQRSVWSAYRIFEKKETKKVKRGKRPREEASNSTEVEAPTVINLIKENGTFSGPSSPMTP